MAEPLPTDLPSEEAVRYLADKGLQPSYDWRDVWQAEHARNFTVAKAMDADLLADIKAGVDRAIGEGRTFEAIADELTPLLQRRGWWGRQAMTDPLTGEQRIVQLGSPRRLRTIIDTNLRMAYSAGRWERIQRRRDRRPYLRYVAVLDERTRDDHRAHHGVILPVDHAFWDRYYPPNGWNCRCTVQQLADRDLARWGWSVSEDPEIRTRPWRNGRTGEVVEIPEGIDPGFDYNVGRGAERAARDRLIEKLDTTPAPIARGTIDGMLRGAEFRRFLAGHDDGVFPVAQLDTGTAETVGATAPTVRLSRDQVAKMDTRHPTDVAPEDYLRLQAILDQGEVVQQDDVRFVFHREGDALWRAAIKVLDREIYLLTLHRSQDRNRRALRRKGRVLREEL